MAKILMAFDGSAEARRAAKKAAEFAVKRGATLVVVQVVPPIIVPSELPAVPYADIMAQQLQEAEREVGAEMKELEASGVKVQSAVLRGGPAQEILRLAEEDPTVELVVVGRSGKGAFARALMGSVSSRLAHACVKPVLIVP